MSLSRKPRISQGHGQGISYTEQIVSAARPCRERPFLRQDGHDKPRFKPPPRRAGKDEGVHSLEEMAMRCLLKNLQGLEQESLVGVPERLVRGIWKRIMNDRLDSTRIWIIITNALHPDPPGPKYQVIKNKPNRSIASLPSILKPISSTTLTHLVSLTLCDTQYLPESLLCLSSLDNLVALHIKGSSESKNTAMISDDTLRHWNRQATRGGTGFQNLRWVFLRWQPDVTAQGLEYLVQFPKLESVITSRCAVIIKEAKKVVGKHGWKMTRHDFYTHVQEALALAYRNKPHPDIPASIPWLKTVSSHTLNKARIFYNNEIIHNDSLHKNINIDPHKESSHSKSEIDTNNRDTDKNNTTSPTEPLKPPPLLDLTLGVDQCTQLKSAIHDVDEIQCYIKIPQEEGDKLDEGEKHKREQNGGPRSKRGREREEEEEDAETDVRKRRIRDAKKQDLLDLLVDM